MHKSPPALVLSVALVACGSDPEVPVRGPEPLTVMAFNVMCSLCGTPDHDPWEERVVAFADIFARHDADLLGLQELTPFNDEIAQIQALLPGYGFITYAPPDELSYPDAIIYYRESRFQVLDSGEYWLSPTPDEPRSSGFASPQLPRLVVWARLLDRAGAREIYFATTHVDNNTPSQALSAPLIKDRTAAYVAEVPVFVVGDFNSKPPSEAFQTLTAESGHGFQFQDTQPLAEEWSVIHNQSGAVDYDLESRIDHIFVAGAKSTFRVLSWHPDLSVYGPDDRYPSDHVPIVSTLEYGVR